MLHENREISLKKEEKSSSKFQIANSNTFDSYVEETQRQKTSKAF